MVTPKDCYLSESLHEAKVTLTSNTSTVDGLEINFKKFVDFGSGSIYAAVYLPPTTNAYKLCRELVTGKAIKEWIERPIGFEIVDGVPKTRPFKSSDLKFCGRIYIYSDNVLSEQQLFELYELGNHSQINVEYRGPTYAAEETKISKALAFISHDSRDKANIVEPLIKVLQEKYPGFPIWYDSYSLKVGDSLRESIEKGLKECKKCVLVLTKNFLTNEGWTKVEFNSIFTREILETTNVILPIWCDVTSRDIYDYSPSLADKVAAQWSEGVGEVARKIFVTANASN